MCKGVFYVGLDLGQSRDHTAIAVVERRNGRLMVRYLERLALGTTYPRVVARVRKLVRSEALRGRCAVVADGTGMGAPVVDLLRASRLGCEVTPVTITGGRRESRRPAGWSVPKWVLIGGLRASLERGEVRIARRMRDTGTLVRELGDVRMTAGRAGRVRIGADGYGEHDDLAIALALACWGAKKQEKRKGDMRLPVPCYYSTTSHSFLWPLPDPFQLRQRSSLL
jgi:hypothetical protein